MGRSPAVLALLVATACGGPEREPEPIEQPELVLTGAKGAPIEIVHMRELEEVARLEDARSLQGGRLFEILRDEPDARVRAAAALALGRFPWPRFGSDVTGTLARALEDPEIEVRLAAAFALGVRGDPAGAGTLLAYRNDPEPRLRARVVEAASRLDAPGMHAQVLLSLRDADLGVRMEAAVGAARWATGTADSNDIDRALLDALHPYRITRESAPKSAVEAELVWRILWALARRKAELGRGPFLEYAYSSVVLERLFAMRGLGVIAPDEAGLRAAVAALKGPQKASDWRVAYEAVVTLGNITGKREGRLSPAALEALRDAVEHEKSHVRAGAMTALGQCAEEDAVLVLLQRGRLDLSASVRAAAIQARARVARSADALEILTREARDDDPVLRMAVADALGELEDGGAVPLLQRLTRDPSLLVSTRAAEKLGSHLKAQGASVRGELHALLTHADNGMRLAAVVALREAPDASDVAPLVQAFQSTSGDGASEVAFNALLDLGQIGGEDARRCVLAAQDDPRPYVRTVARGVVRDAFKLESKSDEPPPSEPDHEPPVPGKDYPLWRFDPMVELSTSRGTMVFELFPAEAPIHVHNFITLVEAGAYDGLTFHRVVPDFVVQGGDYRGDGNGARPWAGEALRAEFTPRKYARGSLGMPRNEDPDSGGSQFFVTHVPTPHLDGRYTIFGELRTGGEVLDQIEIGDRILSARVLR